MSLTAQTSLCHSFSMISNLDSPIQSDFNSPLLTHTTMVSDKHDQH